MFAVMLIAEAEGTLAPAGSGLNCAMARSGIVRTTDDAMVKRYLVLFFLLHTKILFYFFDLYG